MACNAHSFVLKTAVFLFSVLLFAFSFSFVSADEVVHSVNTKALVSSAVSCETPVISSLKPYVYEGALHSFEFSVSDAFQVVVAGSAGDTAIPLNYISRQAGENGDVKMRVNVSSEHIGSALPVSITTLSAKGVGHSVCITTLSFVLRDGVPIVQSGVSGESTKVGAEKKFAGWSGKTIGNIFSSIVGGGGLDGEDNVDAKGTGAEEEKAQTDVANEKEKTSWGTGLADVAGAGSGSILKRTGMVAAARDTPGIMETD